MQIFFHHEMAQTPFFPTKLFFFCEQPAETGGATPCAVRTSSGSGSPPSAQQFARDVETKGLRYSNVLAGETDCRSGMGRSWQKLFENDDPLKGAEAKLRELSYVWQWLARRLAQGADAGPAWRAQCCPTAAGSFFNQLIAAYCGWKDARNFDPSKSITLGDGSPLDQAAVAVAIRLSEELAFDVPWQAGDVALFDNYVTMHGRRPFTGTRKILAAMS